MTDSFTDLAQGRRQRNISGEIFMQSRPISTNDPLELAWPEEVSKEAVHIYWPNWSGSSALGVVWFSFHTRREAAQWRRTCGAGVQGRHVALLKLWLFVTFALLICAGQLVPHTNPDAWVRSGSKHSCAKRACPNRFCLTTRLKGADFSLSCIVWNNSPK